MENKIQKKMYMDFFFFLSLKRFTQSPAKYIFMEVTSDGSTQISYNSVILSRSLWRQATFPFPFLKHVHIHVHLNQDDGGCK